MVAGLYVCCAHTCTILKTAFAFVDSWGPRKEGAVLWGTYWHMPSSRYTYRHSQEGSIWWRLLTVVTLATHFYYRWKDYVVTLSQKCWMVAIQNTRHMCLHRCTMHCWSSKDPLNRNVFSLCQWLIQLFWMSVVNSVLFVGRTWTVVV